MINYILAVKKKKKGIKCGGCKMVQICGKYPYPDQCYGLYPSYGAQFAVGDSFNLFSSSYMYI